MSPINLRFDLKRLSDTELATRFEADLDERERLSRQPRPGQRGMVRSRLAYQVRYLFGARIGSAWVGLPAGDPWILRVLVLPIFLISRRFRDWLLAGTEARIYLLDCDILDAQDEMVGRVDARRRWVK